MTWDAWLPRVRGCFLIGVQKLGDDDGDMDSAESDNEDEVEEVKGRGDANKPKTTPSKKR